MKKLLETLKACSEVMDNAANNMPDSEHSLDPNPEAEDLSIHASNAREVIQESSGIKEALDAILDYNWEKELEDYEKNPSDQHIFVQMVKIDGWIKGHEKTADDIIDEENNR